MYPYQSEKPFEVRLNLCKYQKFFCTALWIEAYDRVSEGGLTGVKWRRNNILLLATERCIIAASGYEN